MKNIQERIYMIFFSPDTKFTPQAGSWGQHGIIRVPGTKHDYIFLVKYYLYRVYNFNTKTMSADLKIIKGAINRGILQSTNYTCRIGGK